MKYRFAGVFLLVLLSSACSGISVNQDFNPATQFSGLQTWDWMPAGNRQGDPRSDNAIVDQRIRSAIETGLQEKGMRKTASGEPNFRVGYQLILDDRVDYETVNNYYGSGWGYRGVYGRYGGPTMATSQTYTREYTMGTLIIDFFDVASHELVWRGSAEGKINEVSDPVKKQERVNEAVQKILGQFPPNG